MKKIPTLFERVFEDHKIVNIRDKITDGCEDAFYKGNATVKIDGSCCAMIGGIFYKRYDVKLKKRMYPPDGAIPCCDPDPVTGHWPHWVEVDFNDPNDKWFVEAYWRFHRQFRSCIKSIKSTGEEVTFEAIGPHFNGNPYKLTEDTLVRHGGMIVEVERNFESIKQYLMGNSIEGLVFWLDGEPVCKIKRSDFGLPWPASGR